MCCQNRSGIAVVTGVFIVQMISIAYCLKVPCEMLTDKAVIEKICVYRLLEFKAVIEALLFLTTRIVNCATN